MIQDLSDFCRNIRFLERANWKYWKIKFTEAEVGFLLILNKLNNPTQNRIFTRGSGMTQNGNIYEQNWFKREGGRMEIRKILKMMNFWTWNVFLLRKNFQRNNKNFSKFHIIELITFSFPGKTPFLDENHSSYGYETDPVERWNLIKKLGGKGVKWEIYRLIFL